MRSVRTSWFAGPSTSDPSFCSSAAVSQASPVQVSHGNSSALNFIRETRRKPSSNSGNFVAGRGRKKCSDQWFDALIA